MAKGMLAAASENFASDFVVQHHIARRSQLRAAGVDAGDLEAQLDSGRWRSLNETVVALHNGPLTVDQQTAAAVLSGPEPVAVAAWTAASRFGLRGHEMSDIHVLTSRGSRVLPVDGANIVVHESRRFDASDIAGVCFPPSVSRERAFLDSAVWSSRPRDATRIVSAAVQQRLTTASRLRDELDLAGRVRHRQLLAAVLADIEGGAHALSELAFVRFCRRHGFPRPTMQVRFDSAGRRRYLDALLVARNGMSVAAEIDGGVHLSLTARWADTARDNDLLLDGVKLLRFPSVAIYTDDPTAVRQIAQALGLVSASMAINPR